MADAKETKESKAAVARHAKEIFTETVALRGGSIMPEGLAADCFRYADIFKAAESAFFAGTLEIEPPVSIMDYAFAPNLRKDHPVNLMSSMFGNLDEIERHLKNIKELDRSEWDKFPPDREVYSEARWDKRTVYEADVRLPEFLSRARQIQKAQAEADAKRAKNEAVAATN